MSVLQNIKKPNTALIKLVESIGILLEIPSTTDKSKFKAPLPSNYDNTIIQLSNDFYMIVNKLSNLNSIDLSNETASMFYNKTLEPGFDYEDAVNFGGLLVRELFNIVHLTLLKLQSDKDRLPIAKYTVTVLVDGTRSSYVAFDTACHIYNHGKLNIIAHTILEYQTNNQNPVRHHLSNDLQRRCKSHFKLQDHCFDVIPMESTIEDQLNNIHIFLDDSKTDIFVMGINELNIGDCTISFIAAWATWHFKGDLLLSKGISVVRPFSKINYSRRFLIYIDGKTNSNELFLKSLKFMRPGDKIIVVVITESRDPLGDCGRDTRYMFGMRSGWMSDETKAINEPDSIGWNDKDVEDLRKSMYEMIANSFLEGHVRVEINDPTLSIGKIVCNAVFNEAADALILSSKFNQDLIIECVHESSCSLIILK